MLKFIKKNLIYIFIILLLTTLGYSTYKIIKYKIDENKVNQELNYIEENITVEEREEEAEIIEDENNPYSDYTKMNLMNVDFSKLKSTNSDVKGWIKVNGTNINYPFVQTTNNTYYLDHSFEKKSNAAGWVFLDYRNDISNFNDKNTIIYAHGMQNKTMFGTLKNILTSSWLENSDNYIVRLSTEYENTLWQVFSVYRIPTTSDYIQIDFSSNSEYESFINNIKNRSTYNFNTTVTTTDRILTLSTCYNNSDKLVLHAKLIKREVK